MLHCYDNVRHLHVVVVDAAELLGEDESRSG